MTERFYLSHKQVLLVHVRVDLKVMLMKGAPHFPNSRIGASPSDTV